MVLHPLGFWPSYGPVTVQTEVVLLRWSTIKDNIWRALESCPSETNTFSSGQAQCLVILWSSLSFSLIKSMFVGFVICIFKRQEHRCYYMKWASVYFLSRPKFWGRLQEQKVHSMVVGRAVSVGTGSIAVRTGGVSVATGSVSVSGGGISVAPGSVSVSVRAVVQRATVAAVGGVSVARAAVAVTVAAVAIAGTPVAAVVGRSTVGAVSRVSIYAVSASRDNSHQGSQTQQLQERQKTLGFDVCLSQLSDLLTIS